MLLLVVPNPTGLKIFLFEKKMKKILDYIALGGAVIGSFLIAANIGMTQVGYVFFLASSVSAAVLLSSSDASKSLLWTNIFFIIMNVIGIVRY